jgi:hypothetical protein
MSNVGAAAAWEAAVQTHTAVLGMTGQGKSYAVRGELEREADAGQSFIVIDPTGVHRGIRLKPDGKTPSKYKVAVIGGEGADLPLDPNHGEKLARILGSRSSSAIINLRGLSVAQSYKFMTAFSETILACNRGQRRLVIDEAHRFAPQTGARIDPQRGQMLHNVNELVSSGRSAGLGLILLTQRPQKLHKDALTQCHALVALGVFHPLDREAVELWVKGQRDRQRAAELVDSLADLPVGQGWIWAPRRDVFERVTFPKIKTFDSMRPLGAGEALPVLPPIDVDELRSALAPPSRPAPVQTKPTSHANAGAKVVAREEVTITPAELSRLAEAAKQQGYELGWDLGQRGGFSRGWNAYARSLKAQIAAIIEGPPEEPPKAPPLKRGTVTNIQPPTTPLTRVTSAETPHTASSSALGAERRPLAALAAAHPGGLTEAQWAVATGMKRTGGSWSTYKSRLKSAGLVEPKADQWYATESGVAAAGSNVETLPPPGPDLVEFWGKKIPGKPADILRLLASIYPESASKAAIAEAVGMNASGGSFTTYLSRLRGPGLIEKSGDSFRATRALMEGGA